jgi:hypothetical protein
MARRVLIGSMLTRRHASAIAAIALAVALLVGTGSEAQPPGGGPPGWQQQADQALGAGRGIGRRLMTEEEWQAHREQMRTLQGEEREKARQAWHEQMRERAKAKGITLPATPGPHRGCPGGMGCGGPARD